MKEIIIEFKQKPFDVKFLRLEFEDIPKKLIEINEDCMIYYYDNEEKLLKFIAKYVKGVLHNSKVEECLSEYIKNRPYGTYTVDYDNDSKEMYNKIYENTLDIQHHFDEKIEKHDEYHFFYNKQMLVHRDYRYKQLRSLNIVCSPNVIGYFVLSDFDIYFDIKQGDLLLFDASQYHYMQRTNNKSEENYRLAINMI